MGRLVPVLLTALSGAFGQSGFSWRLEPAEPIRLPFLIDSNTPAWWRAGKLHFLHSTGDPQLTVYDPESGVMATGLVMIDHNGNLPMWFESVWQAPDGTVYAWYHHERLNVCPGQSLTVPEIGAAVSLDGGASFTDLGIILASGDPVDCAAQNGYFAGGHGDFSAVLSPSGDFFYFLYSNYGGDPSRQGVALARLPFAARDNPSGAVEKFFEGQWSQPGLGGLATPLLPASVPWGDAATDAFWGPSLHWNSYLNRYVILLNRSCCAPGWPQDAVYMATAGNLPDLDTWTMPEAILGSGEWYPWVFGTGPEPNSSGGEQTVRLFVRMDSEWEIVFTRDADQ